MPFFFTLKRLSNKQQLFFLLQRHFKSGVPPNANMIVEPLQSADFSSVIDHITVVSSVVWFLNGSEAGVDLLLKQTSLLLLCRSSYSYAN